MKKSTLRYFLILLVLGAILTPLFFYIQHERKREAYRDSPEYELSVKIKSHIQKKEWDEALTLIQEGFHTKTLSESSIKMLCEQISNSPLNDAYIASKAILRIKNTGLNFRSLFPIAFFKETHETGSYIPENRFGRELQWEASTQKFFIHCGTHGTNALGKGAQKVVTKTILYDKINPQILARGLTATNIQQEIEAMKAFLNADGLISAVAFLEHNDPKTGKKMTAIVTPIYNQGSLEKVLKRKKLALTFKERLNIAKDSISGITSLHTKGYAHRDLGARNHFVSIKQEKGKRTLICVIADLEMAKPVETLYRDSAQGNAAYLCPEAIFLEDMKGEMYYKSDLFALGCLFWKLYFGKMPPWSILSNSEFHLHDRNKLSNAYKSAIEKARAREKELLDTISDPQKKQFLEIILKMTSSNPEERGTALEIKQRLFSL